MELKKSKFKPVKLSILIFIYLTGIEIYSQINTSKSDDFTRIANMIASNAKTISEVWPGFWSDKEAFMFIHYDDIVQVYNLKQKPDGDYDIIYKNKLSDVLKGRAYRKMSYLKEFESKKNAFPGLYEINGLKLYALEPKGSDDFNKINFYLHESFHYYQREISQWDNTNGDTISIKFRRMVLDSIEQVDNKQYISLQNYERNLLSRILDVEDENEIKLLLKNLSVNNSIKNKLIPEKSVDLINRYQRREGTATYVGLIGSTAATQYPIDSIFLNLKKDLKKPLKEFPKFPSKDQQFLRWPQYAIGATYCLIFERLGFVDWKEKLANGATINSIIEEETEISETEFQKISKEISKYLDN
jgi:hypothetical protein